MFRGRGDMSVCALFVWLAFGGVNAENSRIFGRCKTAILLRFSEILRCVFNEMRGGISALKRFRFSLFLEACGVVILPSFLREASTPAEWMEGISAVDICGNYVDAVRDDRGTGILVNKALHDSFVGFKSEIEVATLNRKARP